MHDGVHAAQRVAERGRVGQVAERDLDPHPLVAEPARVAHQAAHGLAAAAASRRSSAEPTVPVAPVSRIIARPPDHHAPGRALVAVRPTSVKPASSIQARISDGGKLRAWLHA